MKQNKPKAAMIGLGLDHNMNTKQANKHIQTSENGRQDAIHNRQRKAYKAGYAQGQLTRANLKKTHNL